MKEKARKPYQQPEFTRVRLVPEEAVLNVCKNFNEAGSELSSCTTESPCPTPQS
jgi:hypothetical protein